MPDLYKLQAAGRLVPAAAPMPEVNFGDPGKPPVMPPYLEVAEIVPQPPDPTAAPKLPPDPPIFLLLAAPSYAPWLNDTQFQKIPIGTANQVLAVDPTGNFPQWVPNVPGSGMPNVFTTTGDIVMANPGSTAVRLGIGSAGQVLTVSGGLPSWQNAPSGFSNPMTTTGDLISSSPGSTPVRVGIGVNGQVLTVVSGAPAWQNSAAGFANPMTTLGDIITAAIGGTPQRLAVGSNGQVLTISGGVPTWQNSAAGFSNPMTTTGDMIYSTPGSTPVRLPIGSNGQILTIAGGVPTWGAGSGLTNPMTTLGDMITGASGGAPQRLGVGANNQVLTVQAGAPAWATPATAANLPFTAIFPSGDTSGVTDQAHIQTAINSFASASNANPGGVVWLAPGAFYVKPTSGAICLTLYQQQISSGTHGGSPVSLLGSGKSTTTVFPVGAGVTGVYMHRASSYGVQFGAAAQQAVGFIRDLTIDGTNTTGAAIGLDYGDGWGFDIKIAAVNFNTAGAIGVQQINRISWTEKNTRTDLHLSNNTTAFYITTNLTPSGDHSSEYNIYDITMFCNANQQGTVIDGVNMGGSHMWIRGNMSLTNNNALPPPGNIAALSVINAAGITPADGHRFYEGSFWIKVEGNSGNGTGTVYPYLMYSDGTGYVRCCTGGIYRSALSASQWNGAEFTFHGLIGDANLASAWPSTSFPGLGSPWNNQGPDALVCVSGGTVTGISVGATATGLTSGAFYVNAGGQLTVNGSVAPTTFNIVPAALPNGTVFN